MVALRTIATLSFVMLSCTTAEPAGDTAGATTSTESASAGEKPAMTTAAFRILEKGAYGMAAQGDLTNSNMSSVEIATTASDYNRLWRTHISDGRLPAVDFSKESVVFLLLGTRSSGGYAVEPESVMLHGASAIVRAGMIRPGKGDMTTQAFTAPYAVLAIEMPKVNAVEWRDAAGDVVVEYRQ